MNVSKYTRIADFGPGAKKVFLVVGCQSFGVAEHLNAKEARWYQARLRTAIRNIIRERGGK